LQQRFLNPTGDLCGSSPTRFLKNGLLINSAPEPILHNIFIYKNPSKFNDNAR